MAEKKALRGTKTLHILDFIAVCGRMTRANESAEQAHFRQLILEDPKKLAAAMYQRMVPTFEEVSNHRCFMDVVPEVSKPVRVGILFV
jgi:hypothetical protein